MKMSVKVSAPGRTEIGGNHTDHQHGCVLAAAVNLVCVVEAEKAEAIEISDKNHDETSQRLIDGILDYFARSGYSTGGFRARISSDVVVGSGLSSSAACEVAIGKTLSVLYNDDNIPPPELARAGQYAENVFLGKPSGLMDQMTSAVGGLVFIDFADPKRPLVKQIDRDFDKFGHALCIVDTKGSHADLTPDYAAIPNEMRAVAEYFGKNVLREVDERDFERSIPKLREKLGDRAVLRALHFFSENRRAGDEADALEAGDFDRFLRLVTESGDSSFKCLQNIYSPDKPQRQDISLALELSRKALLGRGAVRVHGGGFAGTVQVFVPNDSLEGYRLAMDGVFGENACRVLKIRRDGATMLNT
jgi:galactokinase